MKKETFLELINEQFARLIDLTKSKGEEYARSDDQLANFKRQAKEFGVHPEVILAVYLNKHLDSIKSHIFNLGSDTSPVLSEPIEGRIDDAILYLILLKAIMHEQE